MIIRGIKQHRLIDDPKTEKIKRILELFCRTLQNLAESHRILQNLIESYRISNNVCCCHGIIMMKERNFSRCVAGCTLNV